MASDDTAMKDDVRPVSLRLSPLGFERLLRVRAYMEMRSKTKCTFTDAVEIALQHVTEQINAPELAHALELARKSA